MRSLTLPGALVLTLTFTGCDRLSLEVRGAPDPCADEPPLSWDDIRACKRNQSTVLESSRQLADVTGGGHLDAAPLPFGGRPLRHAVALDYSASMYGGYEAKSAGEEPVCGPGGGPYYWTRPEFAELLGEGVLGALRDDEPVHPMIFNAKVAVLGGDERASEFDPDERRFRAALPEPLRGREAVRRRLTAVGGGTLASDPGEPSYSEPGETRLPAVLDAAAALFESFDERDGILWVVTDNIIEQAPVGGYESRDPRYNAQFYAQIEGDPRWQAVVAWPVHGDHAWLCGSTLMIYGFYYSSRERFGEAQYAELVRGEGARLAHPRQLEMFRGYSKDDLAHPGHPFKLKPQDIDAVKLAFEGEVLCSQAEVGRPARCRARLELTNLLNHRQVDKAVVELVNGRCDPIVWGTRDRTVRTATPLCPRAIRQEIHLDEPLGPGESRAWPVTFEVPAIETRLHTLGDYIENAQYHRFRMIGDMRVGIRGLRTRLALPPEALEDVYGVEALPDIFQYPMVEDFDTSICLILRVDNPTFAAAIALLGLIAAVVAGIASFSWLSVPTFRVVHFDGEVGPRLRLTRFRGTPLMYRKKRIGTVRRELGLRGDPVLRGPKIRRRPPGWEYREDQNLVSPVQIRLQHPRKRPARASRDSFSDGGMM